MENELENEAVEFALAYRDAVKRMIASLDKALECNISSD